jgi:hypothetical protein
MLAFDELPAVLTESPRDLGLCQGFRQRDPLAQCEALKDFDIYAGDGHYIEAAAHDPRQGDTKYATGHFFALNLRNHTLRHLGVADQDNRKKEHDMRALKRLTKIEGQQEAKGAPLPQWYRDVQRATQRGVKFIRWLGNHLFLEVPWERALASLRRIYSLK